jgi:hypothetical protein
LNYPHVYIVEIPNGGGWETQSRGPFTTLWGTGNNNNTDKLIMDKLA